MYSATTHQVTVSVEPAYLEGESVPDSNRYVWAYTVRIANNGTETLQLLNRHWVITDSYGRVQEVRGEGVVGEQPFLKPGDTYEYTSGTPLETPNGIMRGSYGMKTQNGISLDVVIPAFSLDIPGVKRKPH